MVEHTYNPSMLGVLKVQGQHGLYSKVLSQNKIISLIKKIIVTKKMSCVIAKLCLWPQ